MIIPIEQLDNVIVTYAFADKLRSGKTITLCSASGKIKFHYIQNAEEVSTAILDKINDYKKNYGNAAKSTVIENTIQSSNADELKKYKDLLDSGAITQEEYDTKKKQILGL
ncbi:MAG: SHOCT domain-containing protein [Clostridia bacterium]|nr:SHOCT domain-containing protein [Clostridia bacterium]